MPGRLTHVLERPLPLGLPVLALGMVMVALCPAVVRQALLGLSAIGSLVFAMTQFWFERRPRWMRGVQFDQAARRSWWTLLLMALLTAVLCRHLQPQGPLGFLNGLTDAAVVCALPLLSCLYALGLQGRTRLS